MLSEAQIERYSRQIILPEVGGVGQQRLLDASLAVYGAGDMAHSAALYLAAAGIGTLRVAPELMPDLDGLNTDCRLRAVQAAEVGSADGVTAMLAAGVDESSAHLLNASCLSKRIPLLWGEASQESGWFLILADPAMPSACYECRPADLVAKNKNTTLTGLPATLIGTLMAMDAIKLVLGLPTLAVNRMLVYQMHAQSLNSVSVEVDRQCPVCARRS